MAGRVVDSNPKHGLACDRHRVLVDEGLTNAATETRNQHNVWELCWLAL